MSAHKEDYLKQIFLLEEQRGKANLSALATVLNLKPASVTEMVRKLAAEGDVQYMPYTPVQLTKQGRQRAVKIIRRHRLWETFLVDVLKYNWANVHKEAETFEHYITDEMENRLDQILDHPEFDPHGAPIPLPDGSLPLAPNAEKLFTVPDNKTVQIVRVLDEDVNILREIDALGLKLGQRVTVRRNHENTDEIMLEGSTTSWTISTTLTHYIYVVQGGKQ